MTRTRRDPATELARLLPGALLGTRLVPGLGERPLVAPRTEEEVAEAIRLVGSEGWTCLPVGRGSKLGWARTPERVDLVLSSEALTGVVAYEPGDGTLTARAGTPMAALARTVAEGGHLLTPDVPLPEEATLGGVVAAGQSGFDRLRFGPVRHNLLGVRVVMADGAITKSGGRLVKNVTGYDLHRLYCGSHGTLCVVLEASLRLQPLPRTWAMCRASLPDRSALLNACAALADLPLRPLALEARAVAAGWELQIALIGRAEVVAWERAQLDSVLDGVEHSAGDAARAAIVAARDAVAWESPTLVIGALPSHLEAALAVLAAAGLAAQTVCRPGVGETLVALKDDLEVPALVALEQNLGAAGARVRWRDLPPVVASGLAAGATEPPGLSLMRGLDQALDPDGVFPTGRLHALL